MPTGKPTKTRDPLSFLLVGFVAVSLLAAVFYLAQFFGGVSESVAGGGAIILTPGPGDPVDPQFPATPNISADDLRELTLALAALITALTGLLGLVATQIWRGREENRMNQTHRLALERERLELERDRLNLERERLDLERQRAELNRTTP
jgi:hypothetical protein